MIDADKIKYWKIPPYHVVVSGKPVFLDTPRHNRIQDEALKSWGHSERINAVMGVTSARKKADRMIVRALKEQHRRDPERFVTEWVDLRYEGSAAGEVIWDLLFRASIYHGTFGLVRPISEGGKIVIDSHDDPWGGEFGVAFGGLLVRLFGLRAGPLRLTIQAREVTAIQGRLDAFWFDYAGWRFGVGRRWSASPSDQPT